MILDTLNEEYVWDGIAIQEGFKGHPQGTFRIKNSWAIVGPSRGRGAPMLLLAPRLGSRLRRTWLDECFVIAEIGCSPPLCVFSLYLPALAHGQTAFQSAVERFHSALEQICPDPKQICLLGAGDLNTQVDPCRKGFGPHTGANEHPGEESRASRISELLSFWDVIATNSWVAQSPTRYPWAKRSDLHHPTFIDFVFTSRHLSARIPTEDELSLPVVSDHRPLAVQVLAPPKRKRARAALFEERISTRPRGLPTRWTPANPKLYERRMATVRFSDLHQVAPTLLERVQDLPQRITREQEVKETYRKRAQEVGDFYTQQAYLIELRRFRQVQRERLEASKLLDQASKRDWSFAAPHRMPQELHLPTEIEGEGDRSKWPQKMEDFYKRLFSTPQEEQDLSQRLLWTIMEEARKDFQLGNRLRCHPNELRDLAQSTPPRKSPGPDGLPSQLLRNLSITAYADLARLFESLLCDFSLKSEQRPQEWTQAVAALIEKQKGASELRRFRPISLLSHVHKLYCKWLMLAVQGKVDEQLGQEQTGYRRGRQASEMIYSALRVTEISREWRQGFVMIKVDLEKAFDTIFQSSIAQGLIDMKIVPLATWGVAREMMEACITPAMYGVQVSSPIEMLRGTRQGSPESGVLFLIGVWQGMKHLVQRWKDEQLGFRVGREFLSHLIFVDDLIVIARDPLQAKDMMTQLRQALGSVGLRINGEKTEYIASMKVPEGLLEGVDSTKKGIKILGRRIRPDNNTSQEVSHRICLANQKFNAIRRVLIQKFQLSASL